MAVAADGPKRNDNPEKTAARDKKKSPSEKETEESLGIKRG